jgi:hypothetical protein
MYKAKDYRKKGALLLAGPAAAMAISFFIVPVRYLSGKAQGLYLEQFKDRVKPGMTIIAHPNVMHAAAWIYKNKDILFYTHGGELEVGLKYKDSKNRLVSSRKLAELIKKGPRGKIIFIMRGDFREGIPKDAKAVFEKYDHEIMFSNF